MGASTNSKTGKQRVLHALREHRGEWVANLYQVCNCMVHSRIADLRRDGYTIEAKRFGESDHRYRLVNEPEGTT